MTTNLRLLSISLLLALTAGACAPSSDTNIDTTSDTTANASSSCLVGTIDCDDTPGGLPSDLPPSGEDDPGSQQQASPVEVSELAGQTDGIALLVSGALIGSDQEMRLCGLVAESLPPQCGEPSVIISNPELIDFDDLRLDQDVYWSEGLVELTGHMQDGLFVISFG